MKQKIIWGVVLIAALAACQHMKTSDQTSAKETGLQPSVYRGLASDQDEGAGVEDAKLWSVFCKADGGADSASIPEPNMESSLVRSAAEKFKAVSPNSIYLYPVVTKAYQLRKGKTPNEIAHNFLVYLCGEFRDRPRLLRAKLLWLKNFNKLPNQAQQPVQGLDTGVNIWTKMTAAAYGPFLIFSSSLYSLRQSQLQDHKLTFGSITGVDRSVPGISVCTTKVAFNEYIAKNEKLVKDLSIFSSPQDLKWLKNSIKSLEEDIAQYPEKIILINGKAALAKNAWDDAKDKLAADPENATLAALVSNAEWEYNYAVQDLQYSDLAQMKTSLARSLERVKELEEKALQAQPIIEQTLTKLENQVAEYKQKGWCTQADVDDYYDFRGDSNFKPNSPESNGMIWYTLYVTSKCKNPMEALPPSDANRASPTLVDSETCQNYFRKPFQTRWSAAKAGLGAWMLYSEDYAKQFASDDSQQIVIYPHKFIGAESYRPFSYSFIQGGEPLNQYVVGDLLSAFRMKDLAFNGYTNLGKLDASREVKKELVYTRLRDAVNRHTNWYASGWDDRMNDEKSFRQQAYSPFVASSYEMSKSDGFTACGPTVPCPPDGFKHWMFVFRVKGSNWYTPDRLGKGDGEPIDFERMWFDETSFGTTGLAKEERAWDRLGTALEDELQGGAILYLHNIASSGEVSDDGLNGGGQ